MIELNKISRDQLYALWKNLSFGLLLFIVLVACTRFLPFYMAPVLSLACALLFYRSLFYARNWNSDGSSPGVGCNLISYCFFYCMVAYCVIGITINILYAWGLIVVPDELIFFNYPYLVSLLLLPVSFGVMLIMVLRGHSVTVCADCRRHYGRKIERGMSGVLFEHEARVQMYNLLVIFGILSIIVWTYFSTSYSNVNQNDRDNYVFIWLVLIVFLFDEIYFIYRYINLYAELCECNEIISSDELSKMSARTFVRVFLMCDDAIYVDPHSLDPAVSDSEVIDTPFQTKRNVNGLSDEDVKHLVEHSFDIKGGELKFFFGRKMSNVGDRSLLRYFYFLDGKSSDYEKLKMPGQWMAFSEIREIFNKEPNRIALLFASDLTRLSTIIVTAKLYDSEGRRRNKIKSYRPTFTLRDVRESNLDFQDDKWIEISTFNADTPFYSIKKLWRQIWGKQLPV